MKRVLYSVLLILGMSAMFCSCEKEEGGKVDNGKLEGKWWAFDKYEASFNGEIIKTLADLSAAEFKLEKLYFDTGTLTFDERNEGRYTFPCSIIGNEFYCGDNAFSIKKITNKELIIEYVYKYYISSVSDTITEDDELYGKVRFSFKGKDIYNHGFIYWYYNSSGKPVVCEFRGKHSYLSEEWDCDYCFDTETYYYRAE